MAAPVVGTKHVPGVCHLGMGVQRSAVASQVRCHPRMPIRNVCHGRAPRPQSIRLGRAGADWSSKVYPVPVLGARAGWPGTRLGTEGAANRRYRRGGDSRPVTSAIRGGIVETARAAGPYASMTRWVTAEVVAPYRTSPPAGIYVT